MKKKLNCNVNDDARDELNKGQFLAVIMEAILKIISRIKCGRQ